MDENIMDGYLNAYSNNFDYNKKETAIILAAGHGKRIKSNTSKMLHKIWGIPTVERVSNSCRNGLEDANIIIVTGIKADEVIKNLGKRKSVSYVYQAEQNGTGHAVQVALDKIDFEKYDGTIFVFPGDMGLLDKETVEFFKDEFLNSQADMMVLTGKYEGDIENNYYGRIVREKKTGKNKDFNQGNVLEIIEYKDILNLGNDEFYTISHGGKKHKYSKKELLEIREYNSGVFAFKADLLEEQIKNLQNNNVQKEIYLTDLIALFNKSGYKVSAVYPKNEYVVMGFNNKSVLREMEGIARKIYYDKLKDIITIEDPSDFFIEESIIEELIQMDKEANILDIKIGKGVYVGKGVKLNYGVNLNRNVHVSGNIQFGRNITVGSNTVLSCFYGQKIELGNDVRIGRGDSIKGNVSVDEKSIIETGVRITGNDDNHVKIGKNVTVKGISNIFGSIIGDNINIEHSIIIKKQIEKPDNYKGDIFNVRFLMPASEGGDSLHDIKK